MYINVFIIFTEKIQVVNQNTQASWTEGWTLGSQISRICLIPGLTD